MGSPGCSSRVSSGLCLMAKAKVAPFVLGGMKLQLLRGVVGLDVCSAGQTLGRQ